MLNNDYLADHETDEKQIYTVSKLNRQVRQLLEGEYQSIWLEAELSTLAMPSSGHWYFTLKDDNAQIRCAMFRGRNRQVKFQPEVGNHVLVRANVSLYEGRGDFQLIIESMEETGDGALQKAFEALKKNLAKEGLFASEHKQALPEFINKIGIITSATGAAVHDIISTLERRFPAMHIVIYPCAVQGKEAGQQIAQAISIANQRNEVDALIVGRGGGSLEDLWAFNEEVVARAIFASELPIISAVGHEVDMTIADFVADVRAPTPTAAAELCSPNLHELNQQIQYYYEQCVSFISDIIEKYKTHLHWLKKTLKRPDQRLQEYSQRLDIATANLQHHWYHYLNERKTQTLALRQRLQQCTPITLIKDLQTEQALLKQQLINTISKHLEHYQHQLAKLSSNLDAISPLATLKRGYSILSTEKNTVITSITETKPGDRISAKLSDGTAHCRIEETVVE